MRITDLFTYDHNINVQPILSGWQRWGAEPQAEQNAIEVAQLLFVTLTQKGLQSLSGEDAREVIIEQLQKTPMSDRLISRINEALKIEEALLVSKNKQAQPDALEY